MTGLTGVGRGNVKTGFTRGIDAVVTGKTGAGYLRVVDVDTGEKGYRGMATVAGIRGRYMIDRFARCNDTVVTGKTVTDNLRMIDPRQWQPSQLSVVLICAAGFPMAITPS